MNLMNEPYIVMCIVGVSLFAATLLIISVLDAIHSKSLDG